MGIFGGRVLGEPSANNNGGNSLLFCHVSAQNPDEVQIVKLFDSAALEKNAKEASVPWQASPEIGDIEGEQLRESIELRVRIYIILTVAKEDNVSHKLRGFSTFGKQENGGGVVRPAKTTTFKLHSDVLYHSRCVVRKAYPSTFYWILI